MAVSLQQTTQIISGVSFLTAHVDYATQIKGTLFFFLFMADVSYVYVRALYARLCCFLGYVASTVLLVPNLSEGADSVCRQLRGDKEYPFSGATSSGKVWRKVPESDARSVEGAGKQCSECGFDPLWERSVFISNDARNNDFGAGCRGVSPRTPVCSLCLSVFLSLSLCVSVCLSGSFCLSSSVSLFLSVCLSVSLCLSVCLFLFVCLCISASVCHSRRQRPIHLYSNQNN